MSFAQSEIIIAFAFIVKIELLLQQLSEIINTTVREDKENINMSQNYCMSDIFIIITINFEDFINPYYTNFNFINNFEYVPNYYLLY